MYLQKKSFELGSHLKVHFVLGSLCVAGCIPYQGGDVIFEPIKPHSHDAPALPNPSCESTPPSGEHKDDGHTHLSEGTSTTQATATAPCATKTEAPRSSPPAIQSASPTAYPPGVGKPVVTPAPTPKAAPTGEPGHNDDGHTH